jgi:hypothetical protein
MQLSPGLNVIIGARGTGKTSLIELVRFCLGVPGNTQEASRRSRDHALSVLGSGQVTVTLTDGNDEVAVARSAADERPRSSGEYVRPAIFSQTEIETVGLQAAGRLRLIDGFLGADPAEKGAEQQAVSEFASLSVEIDKMRREIDELEKQLAAIPSLQQQIAENVEDEKRFALQSVATSEKKQLLDNLSTQIAQKSVVEDSGTRLMHRLSTWYAQVKASADGTPTAVELPRLPQQEDIGQKIAAVQLSLQHSMSQISDMYYATKAIVDLQIAEKVTIEESARQIRKEVEVLSEGSGLVLRRGQVLREQHAKLSSLADYHAARSGALQSLLERRNAVLDKLERLRKSRFKRRLDVVKQLNKSLGPKIRIKLTQNAQTHLFASAISEALKGSGLRFSDIATALAENLSPRALLSAIDNFDQALIAEVAKIADDRAARALAHLRAADLSVLGSIDVDDDASFQLLDGKDFKDFAELSTGQRCTVVLPMVLAHKERIIVVDQPEDHIDNAFIADTLIKAILARDDKSQMVFSTHNPNIPVLGGADLVVQMGSDGRRGFKLAVGGLTTEPVVNAISNVMEGGAEAFAKRSAFYGQFDSRS